MIDETIGAHADASGKKKRSTKCALLYCELLLFLFLSNFPNYQDD
jgi:hypothetical protein